MDIRVGVDNVDAVLVNDSPFLKQTLSLNDLNCSNRIGLAPDRADFRV